MKELLRQFEQELIKFEAPVLKYFNPPMKDPSELVNFIEANYDSGVEIPPELIDVYQWHNGTNYENAKDGIIKLGYFAQELCLEKLSEIKLEIEADSAYEFKKNCLFPFCSSFNGELLAVPLNGNRSLVYCSTSDYEIGTLITMYDDLPTFFLTMIEFYKSNCFELDGFEIINLDFDKYDLYMQIGERMNPQSDYWRTKRQFREM